MNDHPSARTDLLKKPGDAIPVPKRIYGMIALIALLFICVLVLASSQADRSGAKYPPLVDATMEIRLHSAMARIRLTELDAGASGVDPSQIYRYVDQALWYAQAMLQGGINPEGRFKPVTDPALREDIGRIQTRLGEFRKRAYRRATANPTSAVEEPNAREFEAAFDAIFDLADRVETELQRKSTREQARFQITLWFLILLTVGLALAVGRMFHRIERRRAHALVQARTEKERAENNEKWLFTAFESMGDAVITTDDQGRINYLNPVAAKLTEWPPAEARNRDIAEVFHIVNEETGAPVDCPVQRVLREGIVVGLANHTALIARSGSAIPISDSGAPIKDDQGKILGVILVFYDMTERKKMERALGESEQRYRSLFETAPVGVFQTSLEGRLLKINPAFARIFGYPSAEELIRLSEQSGIHRLIYQSPEDRSRILDEALSAEGWIKREQVFLRKDGSDMTADIHIRHARAEDADPGYLEGFVEDITERKRADLLQAQLRHSQKIQAIGTLAGGIAHDFNNILAPIIGYTELCLKDGTSPSLIQKHLKEVLKASLRARDLVRQILAFSRQKPSEHRTLRIQPILKETLKLLEATLPSNIELRREIAGNPDPVIGDPSEIQQILMNLCTNAFHASQPAGGIIEVALTRVVLEEGDALDGLPRPGPYVRLSVSDTGRGMDPSIVDRIFEPYFTTKEQGKGTGLGLSVAHGIVQSYGGMIRVYSEPERGSTFHVYLPAAPENRADAMDLAADDLVPVGTERILLVDDEDQIVEMGTWMLESLGYRVTPMTDSIEALQAVREDPARFDLVVTDQTMPHMTGLELSAKIRTIRPDLPILLCTGFSEVVTAEKARSLGIQDFLMKPILRKDMGRAVRKALDRGGKTP